MKFLSFLFFLLLTISSFGQVDQSTSMVRTSYHDSVKTALGFQQYHVYAPKEVAGNKNLVIVIHGDSPFNNPSYQYGIAKKINSKSSITVSVGILRPGYNDNDGKRSGGDKGTATGDNYTVEVCASTKEVIDHLKQIYNPERIFLVGHSGGAAIAANMLIQYPDQLYSAILISCPCDLQTWRKHMQSIQPDVALWSDPVKSLSPVFGVDKINEKSEIVIIHGEKDLIVPISIAEEFHRMLIDKKKSSTFVPLADLEHDIAFDDKVFDLIYQLLERIK